MAIDELGVEQLAAELANAMPSLDDAGQRVALATYRLLANGDPVAAEQVADRAGLAVGDVRRLLEEWPGVYLRAGELIGFWGLALADMPHVLRVGGRELRAWCAWDTLFLPELIGQAAEVESTCPTTGDTIRLEVVPGDGVHELSPATAVLSFLRPDRPFDADLVMSFCHFVHFFRDEAAAEAWTAKHSNTFAISVAQGFEIGHLSNRRKFGRALDDSTPRSVVT